MQTTILQVEDDPNDVFLLQHAMKKAGVTNPIQVASDGAQAIEYLKGSGKFGDREKYPLPGLVLLDLKLPFVMGLDVLKWIRQEFGSSRLVVLLSASGQESDVAAAYKLGANAFLIKPTEASKLEDMARAIKEFWLTQNTPPPEISIQEAPVSNARPPRFVRSITARKEAVVESLAHLNQASREQSTIHSHSNS
jgi:DNA-binding response OmpR family regulator